MSISTLGSSIFLSIYQSYTKEASKARNRTYQRGVVEHRGKKVAPWLLKTTTK
jgi:hypothetical protein